MSDLNPLKDTVIKIGNWVESGGSVLFALTLQKDTYVRSLSRNWELQTLIMEMFW
mgnify:FL=1